MKSLSLLLISITLQIVCLTSLHAQKQVAVKMGFGFSNGIWDTAPVNVETYSSFSMHAGALLRIDRNNCRFESGAGYLEENNEINYGNKPVETIKFRRSSITIPVSIGYKLFPNAVFNVGTSLQMLMNEQLDYPDDYEPIYVQNGNLTFSPFASFQLGLTERLEFNIQYNQSVTQSIEIGLSNSDGALSNFGFYRNYLHVGIQFNLLKFN